MQLPTCLPSFLRLPSSFLRIAAGFRTITDNYPQREGVGGKRSGGMAEKVEGEKRSSRRRRLCCFEKSFLLNRYERRGKGAFVANACKGRRRRRRHHPFSGSSLFRRRRCRDFQRTAEGEKKRENRTKRDQFVCWPFYTPSSPPLLKETMKRESPSEHASGDEESNGVKETPTHIVLLLISLNNSAHLIFFHR